jgi:DNA-binding transcriptional LysR family regulator
MNINTVDLNLFLVFQAIYATRSVTRAGEQLGMTQSAVSNALKRLRERFDDAIFVRTMEGMVPTPLAERLIGPAVSGLAQFTLAIDMARSAEPSKSRRLFRIAVNEVGHLVMMPSLFKALSQEAPGIKLETMALSPAETRNSLVNGQIDLAIGSWSGMGPNFYQQRLFDETFSVLMCASNPLAQCALSLDDYLRSEHVAFRPHGGTDTELESMLGRAGLADRRSVVFASSHSNGLAQILRETQLLLTLPGRLAKEFAKDHAFLQIMDAPFSVQPFQIRQQWHERVQQDPGHQWFRDLVFRLFNDAAASAGAWPLTGRRDWIREVHVA